MQTEKAHMLFLFFSGNWLGSFFISLVPIILKFLVPLVAMSRELMGPDCQQLTAANF